MTILVGYAPDGRGRAVLHLAATLARSSGDDLVVCAVIPAGWFPSQARVDAEYRDYLRHAADDALARARSLLPDDVPARFESHDARSAAAGLLERAAEHGAMLIVLGSAEAGGIGTVAVGSTTSRLLHSSPLPVALAPRGFRARPGARVARVTAAYGGTGAADDLVVAAASVAARVGATLRLASFAVRPRPPFTAGVGREADASIEEEWAAGIRAAADAALAEVEELAARPPDIDAVIGHGEKWDEALEDIEWDDGDVLVVGSSAIGPVERVFLGSNSSKIVRNAPVPVVVVPRERAAAVAEGAAR
jgi:nucleotide-binding universal stress UspA family protein